MNCYAAAAALRAVSLRHSGAKGQVVTAITRPRAWYVAGALSGWRKRSTGLATGVAVDLPQTKAGPLNIDQKPISIALNDQGQLFLMDAPVANDELIAKLQAIAKDGFDERIYLRADKGITYGKVAEVMASLTSAGYKKVALVTETDKH